MTDSKRPWDKVCRGTMEEVIYHHVPNEEQAELIVDSVNKVKRYEEALENIASGLDRSIYTDEQIADAYMTEARNALKQENKT